MKKGIIIFGILLMISSPIFSQTANEYFENSMKYKAKENYTETARLLRKALDLEPENKEFKKEMAEVQYFKRAFYESIPLYEEMLENDRDNLIILARLSEMYSMSPKKIKSVEYAERAIALKPKDGEINRMLARSFLEVKHYPRALKLYLEAEKALPNDKDIPFKIANCYSEISDYGNAMKYFNRSLELDPNNATKLYQAAMSFYDGNNYKRSIELYQLAEDKGYYKTTSFYDNWAIACIELRDYNQALFYYSKAKEFAPYDRDINMSIADVYSRKGDFSKCREILDQILEINPNDAEVIYNKGMSYYKAGNTGKAEPYFNKAFELDPSLKSLRYTKTNF